MLSEADFCKQTSTTKNPKWHHGGFVFFPQWFCAHCRARFHQDYFFSVHHRVYCPFCSPLRARALVHLSRSSHLTPPPETFLSNRCSHGNNLEKLQLLVGKKNKQTFLHRLLCVSRRHGCADQYWTLGLQLAASRPSELITKQIFLAKRRKGNMFHINSGWWNHTTVIQQHWFPLLETF